MIDDSGGLLLFFFHRRCASLLAVDDTAAGQIVRGHFHPHPVTQQDADVILAHSARKVSQHLVSILQAHAELRGWQGFNNDAFYLNLIFFFGQSYLQSN